MSLCLCAISADYGEFHHLGIAGGVKLVTIGCNRVQTQSNE